ncbi:hypothetical protein AT302_20240 [Pandoraea norimbergensis]|uniref:DUF1254 domain-containing protein n=2 Tax=Pandoraea norimbergensis TaxID=93219 RepID=A0ABN4JQ30_9BURK|nr:hypothetical protein AT302_20240 [Pandoraea norimbergensis]
MSFAQDIHDSALSKDTITEAYIYLLGRMLVIRQEHQDLGAPGAGYNVIKYNPLGSADFVNPNLDVAYLEAWVAVDDKSTVILEVPEIRDRYYTAQLLDEWGEVIVNINERTFPSKPFGKFALVSPAATSAVPSDAARIELHGKKAKLLARVELKRDSAGAVALQKKFKIDVIKKPVVAPAIKIPSFTNQDLLGVEIFENVDRVLASALDVSPAAPEMQQKVRLISAKISKNPALRSEIDAFLHKTVVPDFKEFSLTKSAPYRNHWVGGAGAGNYGRDYRMRTVVDYAGIWGNVASEVVYFVASRDASEQLLDGSQSYTITFAKDNLPSAVVDAYWSVILVGVPDFRVVPNALNRFNFNSDSSLKFEPDGALKIGIGPKLPPGVSESNWLPSATGKPFSLTFRAYVPKAIVKAGQWAPPPVERLK